MDDGLFMLALMAGALLGTYKLWQLALDARETANRVAKDTCARAVVQLLDETVAFSGFRLVRDARGKRQLQRTYTFDYTGDGVDRQQGFVVLVNGQLQAVGLAA